MQHVRFELDGYISHLTHQLTTTDDQLSVLKNARELPLHLKQHINHLELLKRIQSSEAQTFYLERIQANIPKLVVCVRDLEANLPLMIDFKNLALLIRFMAHTFEKIIAESAEFFMQIFPSAAWVDLFKYAPTQAMRLYQIPEFKYRISRYLDQPNPVIDNIGSLLLAARASEHFPQQHREAILRYVACPQELVLVLKMCNSSHESELVQLFTARSDWIESAQDLFSLWRVLTQPENALRAVFMMGEHFNAIVDDIVNLSYFIRHFPPRTRAALALKAPHLICHILNRGNPLSLRDTWVEHIDSDRLSNAESLAAAIKALFTEDFLEEDLFAFLKPYTPLLPSWINSLTNLLTVLMACKNANYQTYILLTLSNQLPALVPTFHLFQSIYSVLSFSGQVIFCKLLGEAFLPQAGNVLSLTVIHCLTQEAPDLMVKSYFNGMSLYPLDIKHQLALLTSFLHCVKNADQFIKTMLFYKNSPMLNLVWQRFEERLATLRFSQAEIARLQEILPPTCHDKLPLLVEKLAPLSREEMQKQFDALPLKSRFNFLQKHANQLLDFLENGSRMGCVLLQIDKQDRKKFERLFEERRVLALKGRSDWQEWKGNLARIKTVVPR